MIQLVIYILLQLGIANGNNTNVNTTGNATPQANGVHQPIGNGGWDFDNN